MDWTISAESEFIMLLCSYGQQEINSAAAWHDALIDFCILLRLCKSPINSPRQ